MTASWSWHLQAVHVSSRGACSWIARHNFRFFLASDGGRRQSVDPEDIVCTAAPLSINPVSFSKVSCQRLHFAHTPRPAAAPELACLVQSLHLGQAAQIGALEAPALYYLAAPAAASLAPCLWLQSHWRAHLTRAAGSLQHSGARACAIQVNGTEQQRPSTCSTDGAGA